MNNSKLKYAMKLINDVILLNDNSDKELAEIIVNYMSIPFFRIDRSSLLLTDVLGIETRKVCENIFKVEKIINSQIDYINPGDYIIAPRELDENFTKKYEKFEDYLTIIKIENGVCNVKKNKVQLNLRGKGRISFMEDNWKYLKIENFSQSNLKDEKKADNLIIDLRCNSGGSILDMENVFEKIFDSKIIKKHNCDNDIIDFQTVVKKRRENVYIIVDKSTCSSAEIFTGLGKLFHSVTLVGTNMYGKNIICKKKVINDIIIHVPYKEYSIHDKSILEIAPDYYIDNICEYNENEIMKLCKKIKKHNLKY